MSKQAPVIVVAVLLAAGAAYYVGRESRALERTASADAADIQAAVDVYPSDEHGGEQAAAPSQSLASDDRMLSPAPSFSIGPNTPVAPPLSGPSQFEQSLLTEGMINPRATSALEDKNFSQFINAFDAQNSGRSNERAAAYRIELEESLAKMAKGQQIDRFTCGANMCVGTIRSFSDSSWVGPWGAQLQSNAQLPIRALALHHVRLPGGGTEHRFMFTTTGQAGFVVKPKPSST